jgi:hypothetical protein
MKTMSKTTCSECDSSDGHECWCSLNTEDSNPSRLDSEGRCRFCVYCGDELDMPCDSCAAALQSPAAEPAAVVVTETTAETSDAFQAPSAAGVDVMVQRVAAAFPFPCASRAHLHSTLRELVGVQGLSDPAEPAYWRALDALSPRMQVVSGQAVLS